MGENPPVCAAFVPYATFTSESGVAGDAIHRIAVYRADDTARPRFHLVPFEKM